MTAQHEVGAPPWLEALQRDFGQLLRAPLSVEGGRMGADVSAYAPTLVARVGEDKAHGLSASAQLKLYHEQYWMRLLNAMQDAYAATARALGYWRFNQLAMAFLCEHPADHDDLSQGTKGLSAWVRLGLWRLLDAHDPAPARSAPRPLRALTARCAPSLRLAQLRAASSLEHDRAAQLLAQAPTPVRQLDQALRIDEAQARAFAGAGPRQALAVWPDASSLWSKRARFDPSCSLIREDWPLASAWEKGAPDLELRPLDALSEPSFWVFFADEDGPCRQNISPILARFLSVARSATLGDVLERLSEAHSPAERDALTQDIIAWCTLALESGWWIGFEHES